MLSMSGVNTGRRPSKGSSNSNNYRLRQPVAVAGRGGRHYGGNSAPCEYKSDNVSLPICLWFDLVESAASISLLRAVRLQPTEHSAGTLQLNGPSGL